MQISVSSRKRIDSARTPGPKRRTLVCTPRLLALQFEPGLELVERIDQRLHRSLRPVAQDDLIADPSNENFRSFEAKFLGQPHSLAAPMLEELGFGGRVGAHDRVLGR